MIVVGLKESEGSTNSLINSLLENKLDLQDTGVSSCRRLGTPNKSSSKPRPVLVVFDTVEKKRTAMKNRAALAGTEIFLNNDLTKEQMLKEKQLRDIKKEMMKHKHFKDKRITVFRGKLWADRKLVTETELQAAGLLQ